MGRQYRSNPAPRVGCVNPPPSTEAQTSGHPTTSPKAQVGVEGFEPPTSCSQSRRATNCATLRRLGDQRELNPHRLGHIQPCSTTTPWPPPVDPARLELATARLSSECSTTELQVHHCCAPARNRTEFSRSSGWRDHQTRSGGKCRRLVSARAIVDYEIFRERSSGSWIRTNLGGFRDRCPAC